MGSVHAGFWSALFHGDPEGGTMFTRLVDVLNSSNTLADGSSLQRPIYLTGMPLEVLTGHETLWPARTGIARKELVSTQATKQAPSSYRSTCTAVLAVQATAWEARCPSSLPRPWP